MLISALMFLTGCRYAVPAAPTPSLAATLRVISRESTSSSDVTQAELRQRALHLPRLKTGAECPRASGRQVAPAYGDASGDGPVYAVDLGPDGISYFSFPPAAGSLFSGSEWSGAKVLWTIAPAYRGPVLIRGGRLDGPAAVRFNKGLDNGLDPTSELWIDAAAAGSSVDWRNQGSYTRLQTPGCYAYQVDGRGFSEIIVFEAKAQPAPSRN